MHEERLFRELRAALERVALRERPGRIVRARVRLGPLSHVSERRLREAWPDITAGTDAAGADLTVDPVVGPVGPGAADVELVSVDVRAA